MQLPAWVPAAILIMIHSIAFFRWTVVDSHEYMREKVIFYSHSAFVIELKADRVEEYKRLHTAVWPDCAQGEWRAGMEEVFHQD